MTVPTAMIAGPKRSRGVKPGVNSRRVSPKLAWNESRFDDERDAAALVLGTLAARAEKLLLSTTFFDLMAGRFGLDEDQTTVLVGEVLAGTIPEFFRPGPGQVDRPVRLPHESEADPQFVRAESLATDQPDPGEAVDTVDGGGEPGRSFWDRMFADGDEEVDHGPDHALEFYTRRSAAFPPQSLNYLFCAEVGNDSRLEQCA